MTVPVGGEHMAALRAFLTDDDAFDRISALLDEDDSWSAYAALVEAAFAVAASRRFLGGYKTDDVIRFVGRTRAALQDEADRIDPRTAERLLRSVLSDPAYAAGLDQDATALAMMAMLKALVTEEGLSGPDLDVFLAESRDAARRQVSPRRLVLRVVRCERRASLTPNAGCWHARPMGITLLSCWRRHGMLTVAVAVGADDFPDAVTEGSGGADMRRASNCLCTFRWRGWMAATARQHEYSVPRRQSGVPARVR